MSPSRKSRTIGAIGTVSLLMLLQMVVPPSAGAHTGFAPYGWESGGPRQVPDSYDHWYCIEDSVPSGAGDRIRMHDAMDYIDSFTNLYENLSSSCGEYTDTIYKYRSPIPEVPGSLGFAPCRDYTGYLNLFCERANSIIDNIAIFEVNGGFGGPPDRLDFNLHYNVRHETGHNMGFGHPYSSTVVQAMQQGFHDPNMFFLVYTTHDRDHLHQFYS